MKKWQRWVNEGLSKHGLNVTRYKIILLLLLFRLVTVLFFLVLPSYKHRPGFKFQTVVPYYVICFTHSCPFFVNLLNAFLVQPPNFSLKFCYYSDLSSYWRYNLTLHVSHSLHLCKRTLVFYCLFCFLLRDTSVPWYCHICQYACFLVFVPTY